MYDGTVGHRKFKNYYLYIRKKMLLSPGPTHSWRRYFLHRNNSNTNV